MKLEKTADCAWCDEEVSFDWGDEEVVCPNCKKTCLVESEYYYECGVIYTLVEKLEQPPC